MKKFVAIAVASIMLISCFVVGASAKLLVSDSYYSYSSDWGGLPTGESPATVYFLEIVVDGALVYRYDGDPVSIHRNVAAGTPPLVIYCGEDSYSVDEIAPDVYPEVVVIFRSSSSVIGNLSGTLVESSGDVVELGSTIFDVGSSLVSFVTSSWITLVVVVSFVLVLCFGSIRRLLKGV